MRQFIAGLVLGLSIATGVVVAQGPKAEQGSGETELWGDVVTIEDGDLDVGTVIEFNADLDGGDAGNFVLIDPVIPIMDSGGDIQRGIYINPDGSNDQVVAGATFYGLNIDLTTEDPQRNETALRVEGDWNFGIQTVSGFFTTPGYGFTSDTNTGFDNPSDGVIRFNANSVGYTNFSARPAAGASGFIWNTDWAPTAMDSGDRVASWRSHINDSADHTGGRQTAYQAEWSNISTNDADAVIVGYTVDSNGAGAYDFAFLLDDEATPNTNPAAGFIGFYVDDQTDRVGGAATDCVFVARLSDGTEIDLNVLVTDGGCP